LGGTGGKKKSNFKNRRPQSSVHGWLLPLHLAEKGPPATPDDGLVYWWDISIYLSNHTKFKNPSTSEMSKTKEKTKKSKPLV